MAGDVMWWGVVTCRSQEPPIARRHRMLHLERTARMMGILVRAERGDDHELRSITLRWPAPDDLNAAVGRVFELASVDTQDFERGPERSP
jgi:hypothetical protein